MNSKRFFSWATFVVVIGLIIWGLVAAEKKSDREAKLLPLPQEIIATDHIKGDPNALVTLVEYGDFQCPACRNYYGLVEELLKQVGTSTVRIVFRHFPLPSHPNAVIGSLAAEAAGKQGKFWEMYGLLYEKQPEWSLATDPTPMLVGYAKNLNLDLEKFQLDLKSKEARERINADYKGGVKVGINATPTFFVNGQQISNPQSLAEFKQIVEDAAKAK